MAWNPAALTGGRIDAGQSHERYLDDKFAVCVYGADWLLLTLFPTLKRGANHHSASGAIEIGTGLVEKMDSCDCPKDQCPVYQNSV